MVGGVARCMCKTSLLSIYILVFCSLCYIPFSGPGSDTEPYVGVGFVVECPSCWREVAFFTTLIYIYKYIYIVPLFICLNNIFKLNYIYKSMGLYIYIEMLQSHLIPSLKLQPLPSQQRLGMYIERYNAGEMLTFRVPFKPVSKTYKYTWFPLTMTCPRMRT